MFLERTALATIRFTTSHMPIGITPGFLFNAIKQQATKGEKPLGAQIRLANRAVATQSSLEAEWKAVHSCL